MSFISLLEASKFEPTPAQERIARVAFDGEASDDDELGRALFGGAVEAAHHEVVVLMKGARIGGTLLAAYRLVDLAFRVPLTTLAPGEIAFAAIVAPDLRLGQQCLRYASGLAHSVFEQAIVNEKQTSLTLGRDDGQQVTLECLPATQGGSALRGRSLVGAVLSEASFFRDEDHVVNDIELFRAVRPRVVLGGQIIIESTPWAQVGLVHALFAEHYGKAAA